MTQHLRCGIVGCGVVAPTHMESLKRQEDVEITWACDLVEEKAKKLAERYGIPHVTTDYHELTGAPDVDVVHVCTDHGSHSPITVAALESGKHVLCEKAFAASTKGLDAMLEAHELSGGLALGSVFQHRFDAPYRYLKELVDEGVFGTILTACVQVHCRRTNDYYAADAWRGTWAEEGGSVLINQAIHFIDSLVWVMGGVESLAGAWKNLTHGDGIETEDTATAALRFKSGALGTLEATSSSNIGWEATLSIHGSEGAVDLRRGKPLKIKFEDAELQARLEEGFATCEDTQKIEAGKSYYGAGHPSQIADFIAAVREGREPFVTAASARHTVDVVLAVYESSKSGRWVDIA